MPELVLPEEEIDRLADALWGRIVGAHCDPIEMNLCAKLALEQRMLGSTKVPFGLDKLGTEETAAYLGIQPETLRDRVKRKSLGVPKPYNFGRKLFWRRSELEAKSLWEGVMLHADAGGHGKEGSCADFSENWKHYKPQ